MRAVVITAVSVLMVCFDPAPGRAQGTSPADSIARVRRYVRWIDEGKIDSLWAFVRPGARGPLASKESLQAAASQLFDQTGGLGTPTEERFAWRQGARQFWSTFSPAKVPEPIMLRLSIDAEWRLSAMGLGLAAAAPPADSVSPPLRP